MSFGHRTFYSSYYTVKILVIKSEMTYLSGRTKPVGSPLLRSQYTLLRIHEVGGRMVQEVNTNTYFYPLIFRT
jgi:hypothetical protein